MSNEDEGRPNLKTALRLALLEKLIAFFDHNKETNMKMMINIDKILDNYDYDIDVIKFILEMAKQNTTGTFTIHGEKYKVTKTMLNKLNKTHKDKSGGFLPILPILAGLVAGGVGAMGLKRVMENKKQLDEIKNKSGGILPLAALIPLILGGISTVGGVAGGVASGVKAANDKRFQEEEAKRDIEHKQKQLEILKTAKGSGVLTDAAKKLEDTGSNIKGFFDNIGAKFRPAISKIFTKLGKDFDIQEKKDGSGLFLEIRPKVGSGIFLPKYND